jgi:flagellar protein FliT
MPPEDLRDPRLPAAARGTSAGTLRLLQRYEALAQVSRRMLDAARENDWVQVTRLETRCAQLIGELKAALKLQSLSVHEQRQRIALLRSILADDAEIRVRAEPWLAQLENLVPHPPVTLGRASVTREAGGSARGGGAQGGGARGGAPSGAAHHASPSAGREIDGEG